MDLVTELAVILVAAGIFTIISKALKQPLILGYIVAGFIVSPHLGLVPGMGGEDSVKEWSEIGIIFLLFALGLEFSFKKLLKVGSSALIMAGTICVGMFITGIATGSAMGWTMMESVFLGGLMSMSSTTIIIKAYDDMGLKNRPYATLVFGTLVVEDLIAVLLMVLLSTMAVSNKFAGGEMIWSMAKLVFYIVLWFLCGIYLIPSFLKRCRKWLNDEILLVFSVGLCFGMVTLAKLAGFSSALGAFVMGSILSETVEGERIGNLMGNIKNLFGAIFFVSVGMMVNPSVIAEHYLTILLIALIAVIGILVCSSTGALLAGKGLYVAVHSGFTMAQLGEFSFIIASLGCSLGVMRSFIYPVIIAVSVITTFTTPYMIKAADPVCKWLERTLPENILARLSPRVDDTPSSGAEKDEWKLLLKYYFIRIFTYGVLVIAVLIFSRSYLNSLILHILPDIGLDICNVLNVVLTMLVLLPLMYGMSISNGNIGRSVTRLLKEKPGNSWPIFSLMLLRLSLSVVVIVYFFVSHFELKGWSVVLIVLSALLILLAGKLTLHRYSFIEKRFFNNLNAKEDAIRNDTPVSTSVRKQLFCYGILTESLTVSPDFSFIGKPLSAMPFRNGSGANIIKIVRGSRSILIPSGSETLFPGDKILVIGSSEQIEAFRRIYGESLSSDSVSSGDEFAIDCVTLSERSFMTGKMLRDISMREHHCMVVSVLRDAQIITNPPADFIFLNGDTVWLAGELLSCRHFSNSWQVSFEI